MFLSEIPLFELLLFGITCFFKNTVKDYFSTYFSKTSNIFNFFLLYFNQLKTTFFSTFLYLALNLLHGHEWSAYRQLNHAKKKKL